MEGHGLTEKEIAAAEFVVFRLLDDKNLEYEDYRTLSNTLVILSRLMPEGQ